MRKKKRINFYKPSNCQIYITNILNSKTNMITVLTVEDSAGYVPPKQDRFPNLKYCPDIRLVHIEHKLNFSYFIYDINFTLEDDELVEDEIVKYLNNHIFDLEIEYES